jgi:hypothetical protein
VSELDAADLDCNRIASKKSSMRPSDALNFLFVAPAARGEAIAQSPAIALNSWLARTLPSDHAA